MSPQRRPNADIASVANGDYWLARDALPLGLVDEIMAGDELLFRARDAARLYEVSTEARKTLLERLSGAFAMLTERARDVAVDTLRRGI